MRAAYLSHVFLAGEDEFVVDEPARVLLKQTTVGVYQHRLLMLHCLVCATVLAQSSRVVEKPCGDGLQQEQWSDLGIAMGCW